MYFCVRVISWIITSKLLKRSPPIQFIIILHKLAQNELLRCQTCDSALDLHCILQNSQISNNNHVLPSLTNLHCVCVCSKYVQACVTSCMVVCVCVSCAHACVCGRLKNVFEQYLGLKCYINYSELSSYFSTSLQGWKPLGALKPLHIQH